MDPARLRLATATVCCALVAGLTVGWAVRADAQPSPYVEWGAVVPLPPLEQDLPTEPPGPVREYSAPPESPVATEAIRPPESKRGDAADEGPASLTASAPLWTAPLEPVRPWSIDYRFRSLLGSRTSYEFGTPDLPPTGWAPLSRLEFPLDSFWHGLEIGLNRPRWRARLEWLTPAQRDIQADMEDYDWDYETPDHDATFTDLGYTRQRWIDGQMLDLSLEIRMGESLFGLPVEVWPTGGFRWQRLNIMCYDLLQVREGNEWLGEPDAYRGDVLTFNQQYYVCYFGGQLRTTLHPRLTGPIELSFAGDWGAAAGYNVDHHLLREPGRFTMDTTHGDAWHVALAAELKLNDRVSVGLSADHLAIRTRGSHRWVITSMGIDETWSHGVRVQSDQTWLTAFLRLRI